MNNPFPDVHALIVALLLLGWLLARLLTGYLFRIEHRPMTWVHRACFVVYRLAFGVSRFLSRMDAPVWFVELPYTLLPLPLCRIGFEVWASEYRQDFARKLGGHHE